MCPSVKSKSRVLLTGSTNVLSMVLFIVGGAIIAAPVSAGAMIVWSARVGFNALRAKCAGKTYV